MRRDLVEGVELLWKPEIVKSYLLVMAEVVKGRVSSQLVHLLDYIISIYILHSVLYTFPKVLERRMRLIINGFFSW